MRVNFTEYLSCKVQILARNIVLATRQDVSVQRDIKPICTAGTAKCSAHRVADNKVTRRCPVRAGGTSALWPSGKAREFDSRSAGSNPAGAVCPVQDDAPYIQIHIPVSERWREQKSGR